MRRKAFTLPELLVSTALGALVLGLLVALVIWGMRIYTVQSVESQRFQLGSLLVQRLRTDLRAGCVQSVSVGPDVIAIQRLADLTSDGSQVWDSSLVVYTCVEGVVRRGTCAFTGPPRRLTPEELAALAPESPVVLLDSVSSFAPRLDGRVFSLSLVTTYRVPYRVEPGRQDFATSLTLRENP